MSLKDIFTRIVEVGDKVLIVGSRRNTMRIITVEGVRDDVLNGIYKGEFIILKRKDGTTYFTNDDLPLKYWHNVYKSEFNVL